MREQSTRFFQSVEDVYLATKEDDPLKTDAELLLGLREWLVSCGDFDPMTGQSLPQGLCSLLVKIRESINSTPPAFPRDRVGRILDHTKEALLSTISNPREEVLREHAMLPVFAAREFDSASVQWLSRQPGRSVREKLVGKPYLKAIRRRMSADTPENRLFKALVVRLEKLLLARDAAFNGSGDSGEEEFLLQMQRWLRGDESSEIGQWTNLPPNNTLLQNKNYRKVWDSWLCLLSLDENIAADHKRLKSDFLTVLFWSLLATFEESSRFRIVQQPCLLDYDNFLIQESFNLEGRFYPEGSNGQGSLFQIRAEADESLRIFVDDKFVSLFINEKGFLEVTFFDTGKSKKNKKIVSLMTSVPKVAKMTGNFLFDGELRTDQRRISSGSISESDDVVIDLSSTRPSYDVGSGSVKSFPCRLITQCWQNQNNEYLNVDCGEAKAIKISSDIQSISILNVFHDYKKSPAVLNSAALFFSKKLSKVFKAEKLTYLVPDSINEFTLENLRKSINFYFPASAPLPRSIAAVFSWQNSENFDKSSFKDGDIVIVVDRSVDGISMTPLAGYKSSDLAKSLPSSKGVYWERHPTTILTGRDPCASSIERAIADDGCQLSQEIASLVDIDELLNPSAPVSWVDEIGQWYDVSRSATESICQSVGGLDLPWVDIRSNVEALFGTHQGNIYLLPTEERFLRSAKCKSFICIDASVALVSGGQILSKWQAEAGELPLWKDHLPDLSFKIPVEGRWGQFDVVKGATIIPLKGERIRVPVEKPFTLPAGQPYFSFQLLQGSKGQAIKYRAFLKSPAFPLANDTVCTLKMIYTYGADDPYSLKFVPLDIERSGFRSVNVEWREIGDVDGFDLNFPRFPQRHSWDYFERYPKKDSADTSNLLEWLGETLDHFPILERWISEGTLEDSTARKLRKRIRFPVLTIWNQEHSLSDEDAPDWFRNKIRNGVDDALCLMRRKGVPRDLKIELVFFLSCLHRDAPRQISVWLLESLKKTELLEDFYRHIAFALGDCSQDWQEKILKECIASLDSNCSEIADLVIQVFGLAMWRSEGLFVKLNYDELMTITNLTLEKLEKSLDSFDSRYKKKHYYDNFDVVRFELLFALMRTRGANDKKIKDIFVPGNEISAKIVKIIDEIVVKISGKNIDFNSFLKIKLDKPKSFYKTPDLLYALRMYLTGESGANAIQVTEVNH